MPVRDDSGRPRFPMRDRPRKRADDRPGAKKKAAGRSGKPLKHGAGTGAQRDRSSDAPREDAKRARPLAGARKPAAGDESSREGAPPRPRRPEPMGRPLAFMRIAKALARAGLCSRRDAEKWIAEGRVRVNGRVISSPALDVGPHHRIEVDGTPLPMAEGPRLWRFHKPKGCVTTHRDPEGRPTVFDMLPKELGRVISVGRLDFNTEGLLLLTNDGELARHMELPATGWLRRYRVRAFGRVTQEGLDRLKQGIEIEGVQYGPIEATLDSEQGSNVWISIGLREGKNREVRKILGSLGLEVNRLLRVSFGPFQLLDLEAGKVEGVKRRVLAEQLGPKLARELGLDGGDDEDGRPARTAAPGQGRRPAPGKTGPVDRRGDRPEQSPANGRASRFERRKAARAGKPERTS